MTEHTIREIGEQTERQIEVQNAFKHGWNVLKSSSSAYILKYIKWKKAQNGKIAHSIKLVIFNTKQRKKNRLINKKKRHLFYIYK